MDHTCIQYIIFVFFYCIPKHILIRIAVLAVRAVLAVPVYIPNII